MCYLEVWPVRLAKRNLAIFARHVRPGRAVPGLSLNLGPTGAEAASCSVGSEPKWPRRGARKLPSIWKTPPGDLVSIQPGRVDFGWSSELMQALRGVVAAGCQPAQANVAMWRSLKRVARPREKTALGSEQDINNLIILEFDRLQIAPVSNLSIIADARGTRPLNLAC